MAMLVTLPAATPRDPEAIREAFDLGHMLRPRAMVGWLFLVGGICLLLPALFMVPFAPGKLLEPPMPAVTIGALAEGLVGYLLVRGVRRIKRRRLRALTHGQLVPAIVTSHKLRVGSAIVIQRLDTLVTFDVHPPSRPRFKAGFRMPDPTVRKRLPVGSPVQAMFDPETGATLFPAEFGKEIVLEG